MSRFSKSGSDNQIKDWYLVFKKIISREKEPENLGDFRRLAKAYLESNSLSKSLFERFGPASRDRILDSMARLMAQEAWHDAVQERLAAWQQTVRKVYTENDHEEKVRLSEEARHEALGIMVWLKSEAYPAMKGLRDPFAFLFGDHFSLWVGWHLLGNELGEEWINYVHDMAFSPDTEEILLLLLGMMPDHIRQHFDLDDKLAYRYAYLKLLPWMNQKVQEEGREPLGRRICHIVLNSLHVNADPLYILPLGKNVNGEIGDFSVAHLRDFIRELIADISRALPAAGTLLRNIVTASSEFLSINGEPPLEFTYSDSEPLAVFIQTGREMLELYAEYVERHGGVREDGTDAFIWDFITSSHPLVREFRKQSQHRLIPEEAALFGEIHRALRDGSLIDAALGDFSSASNGAA
jgi:hypothetical protein